MERSLLTPSLGSITSGAGMDPCDTDRINDKIDANRGWSLESALRFAALVHIAQSGPADLIRHVWDPRELAKESLADGAPVVESGHVQATDRPGLGVELKREILGQPIAEFS